MRSSLPRHHTGSLPWVAPAPTRPALWTAFKRCPPLDATFTLRPFAVPFAPFRASSQHLAGSVPDLYLLEFALVMNGGAGKALEALLRRVLVMAPGPAVVLTNFFFWGPPSGFAPNATAGGATSAPRDRRQDVQSLASRWRRAQPPSASALAALPLFSSLSTHWVEAPPAERPLAAKARAGAVRPAHDPPGKPAREANAGAAACHHMQRGCSSLQHEIASAVGRYYSLPTISTRDALHPAAAAGEVELHDWLMKADGMHPPPQLQSLVASMLVDLVARAARSVTEEAQLALEAPARAPGETSHGDSGPHGMAPEQAGAGARRPRLDLPRSPPLPPLPTPMYAGQRERFTRACYSWGLNQALHNEQWNYRLHGPPPYGRRAGWEESVEQRRSQSGVVRTNPGLVANASGAVVELVLNTAPLDAAGTAATGTAATDPTAGAARGGRLQALLQFEFLQSYEHMGRVRIRCADGCTCDDATIDAHSAATRESTHRVYCLPVTQARRCRVTLTVLPSTSSGEHKWLLHELHVLHVERGPDGGAAAMGADGSCEKLLR